MTPPDKPRSTRRDFIVSGSAAAAACTLATGGGPSEPTGDAGQGAPPAPAPSTPDEITATTIAEAEKLAVVRLTDDERAQILGSIARQLQQYRARRSQQLDNGLAPATVFDPRLPGERFSERALLVRSDEDPGALPADDRRIAYAPVTALSRWIERGDLSSLRLTEIYLDRLERLGPKLECVVTITRERAEQQARRADAEIAAGRRRGPLHGIPWGAKDLFDTADIRTSWGATPYRDRVPADDAKVVRLLEEAGAVLVAKLSLGALAYGDIWFDGRTNNPWKLDEGSSGSSAGSAAATAAGLIGFALGTETYGSIVSPCMRCGATGLRPTFGRVSRAGAMALCWSLDKIGPIARRTEDCALVLAAINGYDSADPCSIDMPLAFDATRSVRRARVGYDPAWFEGEEASDLDRRALEASRAAGLDLVEVKLPDWPYQALLTVLLVEAAAAFEELTLSDRDDELVWQEPDAWPNTFRRTRFAPAIEYVQAQRFRRRVMEMMAGAMQSLDALISPSFAGSLLLITNNTGHPSLTIRCGFKTDGTPHGITLWGRRFDEGRLCGIGMALERELDVWRREPAL